MTQNLPAQNLTQKELFGLFSVAHGSTALGIVLIWSKPNEWQPNHHEEWYPEFEKPNRPRLVYSTERPVVETNLTWQRKHDNSPTKTPTT